MFSRPGPGDTEGDLLRSQEQFVAGSLNPSAVVCRSSRGAIKLDGDAVAGGKREHTTRQVVRDVVTLDGLPSTQSSNLSSTGFPPKKKSRFKDRNNTKKANINHDGEEVDAAKLLEINDRDLSSVLLQIQEKDVQCGSVNIPQVSLSGFPNVLHRGIVMEHGELSSNDRSMKSAKSLFAQQFSLAGGVSFGVPQHSVRNGSMETIELKDETIKTHKGTRIFQKSLVITGEGLRHHTGQQEISTDKEVDKIHQENVTKLASMTQEEIKEEQARLRMSLDPNLVAFLTSQHKRSGIKQDDDSTGQDKEKKHYESDNSKDSVPKKQNVISKHVHFSDIDMVSSESEEEKVGDQQSDEGIRIGDQKVSEKWLHMDTVESDKLKWMKDCPAPKAVKSNGGQQARFDFSGHLVSKSEDIPEYLGLHHHGNEPSSAGYTLEELFILARSSFLQQRVLALHVLARIIKQDQQGTFQGCVQEDVLSVLLDAGVLFLLRWSLDDSSEAVVTAALQGFNAILTVPRDKEEVEKVFNFSRGLELPSLSPFCEKNEKSTSKEDKEEDQNMTDAELLKKDVVKGLIQMMLLPRLRYILEICCPAVSAVLDILSILTRISQHSTQTASEVFHCPRLLETIIKNFLPMSWSAPVKGNSDMYHLPICNAMRLMKTLCSAGRNMAATLITKYELIGRVLCYTALDPQDMQLELEEAHLLYIESLRTWRVCILYALSCNIVLEMYKTFIDHLQVIQCLSLLTPEEKSRLSCATAIFGIIEAAVYATGTSMAPHHTPEEYYRGDSQWPVSLNWSHVAGLMPLIVECVTKSVKEILESENPVLEDQNLSFMSGEFAVLTSFYSKLENQVSYSPVDILQQIDQLMHSVLLPLVESSILDWCFNAISSRSIYNIRTTSKLCAKQIPCLPDHGSLKLIMETGLQSDKNSLCVLVGFVTSVLQLLNQVTKLHKGVTTKLTAFLCKEAILNYLNIVQEAVDTSLSFFARQEHHLQYFLLKLFHNVIEGSKCDEMTSYIPLWHEVSLSLFSKLSSGDEFYAYDLLSTVLFDSKFFLRINDPLSVGVTRDLSQMSLSTEGCSTPPLPITSDDAKLSRTELLSEALRNLPQIRSTFMGAFHDMKRVLSASRSLCLHEVRNIKSYLLPPYSGPLLPQDWMFLPLVDLHNQAFGVEMKGRDIDTLTEPAVSIVTTTLQLVLMLEEWRPSCLRHVSLTARVVRLICVFLTGNDLFLNKGVHNYMSCLLGIYSHPNNLGKLDFSSPVPGIRSIYDLYASLLSQYSAVSFGDALFACFVVLPLTQRHDPKFRRAVLDEHIGVLRALSLPLDQLPVSLDEFLYPVEQSASLLSLYLRALATESVRPQWCPLFYLIAVHHINAFIFQRVDPLDPLAMERKAALLRQVLAVKTESVRSDILYYHKPADTKTSHLLEKFTNLPPDRELLLRHRDSSEKWQVIYQKLSTA